MQDEKKAFTLTLLSALLTLSFDNRILALSLFYLINSYISRQGCGSGSNIRENPDPVMSFENRNRLSKKPDPTFEKTDRDPT